MIKLLIIADDLTGALDTGVHFSKKGIKTVVIPDSDIQFPFFKKDPFCEVVVINTESRHLSALEAADRVRQVAKWGTEADIKIIYKKTDSTLRGNIGAELKALLEVSEKKKIPFIPAYPALKRYTRNGYHYVDDKLLHLTRFAEDPLEPVRSSYIPEIIMEQAGCDFSLVPLPPQNHRIPIDNKREEILIFDCGSDQDLRTIGNFLAENNLLNYVSGSAGFAPVLTEKISFLMGEEEEVKMAGSCLMVNGSLNPVSTEQVRRMEGSSIELLYLESEVLNSAESDTLQIKKLTQEIISKMKNSGDLLINSMTSREDLELYLKSKYGSVVPKKAFETAARRLGELFAGILKTESVGMLIVIGGDTLMAIIREMEIQTIYPVMELLPGVVVSKMSNAGHWIYLITKPGGYGDSDTLFRIFHDVKNIRK